MDRYLQLINSFFQGMPPWAVALMVFIAVLFCFLGVGLIWRGLRRKPTREELQKKEIEQDELETVAKLTLQDRRNGFDRWFSVLLEESGSNLSPLSAALIVLGVLILSAGMTFIVSDNIELSTGVGLICTTFPLIFWSLRRTWRIGRMRKLLPETLEAVGDAIRGGMTIEEAVKMTAEQIENPLKTEFSHASRQLEMGQTPTMVMNRMARRIPISEFRIFSTAVLVHRTTGGNLAYLAERLARSARDRSEFNGHLTAITAGSRMSILGLIVVTALALMILCGLDTSYLFKFLLNPYGPMLIGISVSLFVVGGFWAWQIMRVRY